MRPVRWPAEHGWRVIDETASTPVGSWRIVLAPAFAIGVGVMAGLCWVGASLGINDLFEQRSLGLWAINAGYHTLAFTLFGVVFGLWH